MFHEEAISLGARRINLARGPANGPPLLLFHGVTRRWQSFVPVLPLLATRWEVTAVDFRGHGRSDRAEGGYFVTDYVDDAVALVESRFSVPVTIYGHSLGSMVAAGVAGRLPGRVRGLVLEDPPFTTMGSRIRETALHDWFRGLIPFCGSTRAVAEIARDLAEIRTAAPGAVPVRAGDVRDGASLRFTARSLQELDPRVLEPIVSGRWLDGYNFTDVLPKVSCPTLLLQADPSAGGMLIDAEAATAEALIRDCIRIRFPGTGHLIHWLATESLLRMVLSFLESLAS
jgi:pimeloyl-ACP methyl ester carboxylesterase